jgi:hypothetical protein
VAGASGLLTAFRWGGSVDAGHRGSRIRWYGRASVTKTAFIWEANPGASGLADSGPFLKQFTWKRVSSTLYKDLHAVDPIILK